MPATMKNTMGLALTPALEKDRFAIVYIARPFKFYAKAPPDLISDCGTHANIHYSDFVLLPQGVWANQWQRCQRIFVNPSHFPQTGLPGSR
jgi:hypothetical protein